jgi:hypothetical protein
VPRGEGGRAFIYMATGGGTENMAKEEGGACRVDLDMDRINAGGYRWIIYYALISIMKCHE